MKLEPIPKLKDVDYLSNAKMAERIRAFDWTNHPLGAVENWPQSLKIAIRIMLASRYAMWMGWGPDFHFFCNDAYLPTVGIKEKWVLGASAKQVWQEIWPDIGPRAESVVETGNPTWDEALLLFLERSGYIEETYHTFSYSPLPDDAGGIGGMLCVVTEETERVINERQLALLHELAADLAATKTEKEVFSVVEQRFKTLITDISFALIYLFEEGGAQTRLAAAHNAVPGSPIAPLVMEVHSENQWPAKKILDEKESVLINDLSEHFFTLPNGPWGKTVQQAIVVPIAQQGQKELAGFLVVGLNPYRQFDSTYNGFINLLAGQICAGLSNVRAYEEERKRLEALAKLDRAKTVFFSNISHEFRTPLTLMLGPMEDLLMKNSARLSKGTKSQLELVHRNSLRLLKMVNTLLDFSRIEAGHIQAVFEPVDLALFTEELTSVFRSTIEKAGLTFNVHCPKIKNPKPVYVNRNMWEKIVFNLLSNAFKFTLKGKISVSLKENNNFLQLCVADTGIGIAQNELENVFKRFHRIENTQSRSYEGTGIGLALVQELVKLHGGRIEVQSRLKEGSTFTVFIPTGRTHFTDDQIGSGNNISSSTTINAEAFIKEAEHWLPEISINEEFSLSHNVASVANKPQIVLAEDNSDMRRYVCHLLADEFEVIAVEDGQAALEAVQKNLPDLILTDIMMPRLDGLELLQALRNNPSTKTIPIILLSARAGEEARVVGLEHGADDYLTKPFNAKELMARIHSNLKLARSRCEQSQSAKELYESESRYRQLIEGLPAAVYTCDIHGFITLYNDAAVKLWGREPELGKDSWCGSFRFYRPDGSTLAPDQCPMAIALKEERAVRGEEIIIERPDGTKRNVLPYPQPIRDESGSVIGALNMLIDITEIKQTEALLRESESRFRALTRAVPAIVWTANADGKITFANDQWFTYCGITPKDKTERWPELVLHPNDRDRCLTAWKHALETGEDYEIEVRNRRYDGQYRWFITRAIAARDWTGSITGWFGTTTDIHDLKMAEAALRESESRFRYMANGAPVLIWVSDLTSSCTWFNKPWLNFVGRSMEKELGEGWLENIHGDDLEKCLKVYTKSFTARRPFEMEYRLRRYDGEYRWVLNQGIPRYGELGEFIGYIGSCIDITEGKQAGVALKESEERYRLAINAANVGTWDWDIESNHVTWSEQIYKFHGLNPGEFDGRVESFMELIHPDDRDYVSRAIRYSIESLNPYSLEMRIIKPSGEVRWIAAKGRVITDATGKVVRMLGATIDITEQRKAEETLRERTRSLAVVNQVGRIIGAELDLHKLVEAVTEAAREVCGAEFGIFVYNIQSDNEKRNVMYSLSGLSEEWFQKLGNPYNSQLFAPTFEGQGILRIGDLLEDERYINHNADIDDDLQLRSYMAVPVVSRSGEVLGGLFLGHSKPDIFTDESEMTIGGIAAQAAVAIDNANLYRAVQKELAHHKHMEEELSRSNQELEQFAYVASHDLQEPLHMITSFGDLLARRCEKKLEIKEMEYLNFIQQGSLQAITLIRELLEYSRIGRDKNWQMVDFAAVITEVLSNLKVVTDETQATIRYSTLPKIKANHLEMTQLFQNLISNAIKYRNGAPPEINIEVQKKDNQWLFAVKDNGIGISPQYKERIFLMFQRLHAKSEYSGTGIGLAVCKKIVEHHGGKIWVDSEPGRGATFYFTINSFD